MTNHQSQIKYFVILLFTAYFLLPNLISAATAVVEIDTGTENINAMEGVLHIPTGVSINQIFTGNSAILLWITTPTLDADAGTISFAGMTPGGFRGKYPLFSITGEFSEGDLNRISFTDLVALKNDGEGTNAPVNLNVTLGALAGDVTSPETFQPEISSSPEIFDGQTFVSFVAQDKGVGIERYEVAFGWILRPFESEWVEAKSPLVLTSLQTFQRIHIRAIDKSGNFVSVSIAGPYHFTIMLISAIVLLICLIMVLKRLLRPHS